MNRASEKVPDIWKKLPSLFRDRTKTDEEAPTVVKYLSVPNVFGIKRYEEIEMTCFRYWTDTNTLKKVSFIFPSKDIARKTHTATYGLRNF